MAQQELTIASILQELAREYDTLVNERDVLDRVLERRPSQAKDPYASIREKLRWDGAQVGWVRLGQGKLLPLRVALQGLRFRVIPDADEIGEGSIGRVRLLPFVSPYNVEIRLMDSDGRLINGVAGGVETGYVPSSTPLPLGGWFQRVGFRPGDSMLFTIRDSDTMLLQVEYEPQQAFRTDDVLAQEREIVDALAEQIDRSRSNMLTPDECVLPIYARAPWRTEYPGRPWQVLVARDRRLRLLDGMFIADGSFRRPMDRFFPGEDDQLQSENDDALLDEIAAFQAELLSSRRDDANSGVWDGQSPRASTARVIFDMQAGTSTVVYLEPVNTLHDHRATIDVNLENGQYADADWAEGEDFDLDDEEFDELDDDLFQSIEPIDDMQSFIEQNPILAEAAQKLMDALTPEEVEQLQRSDDPEDAQRILAGRFQQMLPGDPSLFATFAVYVADVEGDSNATDYRADGLNGLVDEAMLDGEEWDEGGEEFETAEVTLADPETSRKALERSNDLMERFYEFVRGQGKSEATASSRTRDLWVYAEFLASYYGRSLAEGDYATLDECLFFFYPRKVMNSSPRAAREMCTSLKQFYTFLRNNGVADDTFAQAIWRRREQAARVVELYEHIDSDSPQFERLFAHLFAPYTV
ncbi:MAG TPA: hypothetical protein VFT99_00225 [Roseiflexaceae bacterium]|nr:hypothetical protein [Roseiflexaceae bacterium]